MRKDINYDSKSKLANFAAKKTQQKDESFSTGLVIKKNLDSRARSFRLRPQDIDNFKKVNEAINNSQEVHRLYNDSEILRGILSMIASNLDVKRLINFIKNSN